MKNNEQDAKRWQALLKYARVEHIHNRDMEPVFEVQLPVIWLAASKGFQKAVDRMIKEQLKIEKKDEKQKF